MELREIPRIQSEVIPFYPVNSSFVTPKLAFDLWEIKESSYIPTRSIEQTLQSIFPTNQEESKLQKARKILGETVKEETDEQLQIFLTEMQYLLDSWLDEYEKQLFDGKTLNQVVRGK